MWPDCSGPSTLPAPRISRVAHGDFEARAERRVLAYRGHALLRDFAQRLAPAVAQISIGVARGTADTAADLVQLRQTHVVRVFDDEGVRVRDVDAGFDDGRADEDVYLAVRHLVHDVCDFPLPHLAVDDADGGVRRRACHAAAHFSMDSTRLCR